MKLQVDMNPGNWLKNKAVALYGPDEYGINVRFQTALKDNGLEIPASSVSILFNKGLNTSTLASPDTLRIYASTLNCSVIEILEAHGYDVVDLDFSPTENGRQLISLIREATENNQDDKLGRILAAGKALMDVD